MHHELSPFRRDYVETLCKTSLKFVAGILRKPSCPRKPCVAIYELSCEQRVTSRFLVTSLMSQTFRYQGRSVSKGKEAESSSFVTSAVFSKAITVRVATSRTLLMELFPFWHARNVISSLVSRHKMRDKIASMVYMLTGWSLPVDFCLVWSAFCGILDERFFSNWIMEMANNMH